MGSRLSMPKGPAGTTEASHARPSPWPRRGTTGINSRTIVAPAAAFTMACILFVYTRTSIKAAKANAQRHRDVDSGGEGLNLLNESRRRHGLEQRVEKGGTVRGLAEGAREQFLGKKEGEDGKSGIGAGAVGKGRSEEENRLRAAMGKRGGGSG